MVCGNIAAISFQLADELLLGEELRHGPFVADIGPVGFQPQDIELQDLRIVVADKGCLDLVEPFAGLHELEPTLAQRRFRGDAEDVGADGRRGGNSIDKLLGQLHADRILGYRQAVDAGDFPDGVAGIGRVFGSLLHKRGRFLLGIV